MSDESNVIDFPVRATGASEAAQAVGSLVAALKNTQGALDATSKNAKSASDAVGGLNKNAKATGDALAGAATKAREAAKEKAALAKAADDAAKSMKKERDAAAELVSTTLSPLTKEQDKLTKQISQLTTELGRLREEREKALAGGFDQRSQQIDTRIANTQQALQQLRSSRVAISRETLGGVGGGALGTPMGATAVQAAAAEQSLNGMSAATARSFAAMNILGGEIAQVNPELATMVQAVGRASGPISGFTSLLGPWALGVGAAVAGLGLWIDNTRRETEEQEKLAEAIKKSNDAIEEQIQTEVKAARALVYKGSADPLNAQLSAKRAALADAQKGTLVTPSAITKLDDKGNPLVDGNGNPLDPTAGGRVMTAERQREIEDLQKGIAALEEQKAATAREEEAAANQKAFWEKMQHDVSLGGPGATAENAKNARIAKSYLTTHDEEGNLLKTGDGTTAAGRREFRFATSTATGLGEQSETIKRQLEQAKQFQEAQKKVYEDGLAAQRTVEARKTDDAFKAQQKRTELMRLGVYDEVQAHKDKEAQIVSLAEFRARKEQEHDQARKQQVAEYAQLGTRAYQQVGVIGINALSALAKGQHITGKMILASLGDLAVAEGTRTLFQGLAMSANPLTPGAGAGMIGIGTAEIAFGIGIGAATRGGAQASGGATGSPVATAPNGQVYWNGSSWERGNPYAPSPANTNYGSTPVSVVNNYQFSSIVPATDQDMVRLQRMNDQAYRSGAMRRPKAS